MEMTSNKTLTLLACLGFGLCLSGQAHAQTVISACSTPRADIAYVEARAKENDTDAILRLAILHKEGLCFPANKVKAVGLMKRAANAGSADALYELAQIYRMRTGDIKRDAENSKKVQNLYFQAANAGHKRAQYDLGEFYAYGKIGLKRDPAQVLHWFKKAAAGGDMRAARRMAQLYTTGIEGMQKNLISAEQWLRGAAQTGDTFAVKELADFLLAQNKQKHMQEIIRLYEGLANRGIHSIGVNLGDLYSSMDQGPMAYFWYKLAESYGEDTSKKTKRLEWSLPKDAIRQAKKKIQTFRQKHPPFNRFYK